MPIAHRARLVITGLIVASFVLVAPPAHARVRAGSLDKAIVFLLDNSPSWFFPGATREDLIALSALHAGKSGNGYTLGLTQSSGPSISADVTTRIAFFPPGAKPWALEWQNGDTKAAVVTEQRAGTAGTTADALPSWTAAGPKIELQVNGDTVRFAMPRHLLEATGVKLSALSGTQIQDQETRPDGSVVFQGSPIVAFGALTGHSPNVLLPAVGIPYDTAGHTQTWIHVDMCPDCKLPPRVTVTDADLEASVKKLEATTTSKNVSVTLGGPVLKSAGWGIHEVRFFTDEADPDGEDDDLFADLQSFYGALCAVLENICQLILGNNFEATDTGQGTLETNQVGRHVDFTIGGLDPQTLPGRESYQFLVMLPDGTSGAVWTPWLKVSLPPGVVSPTSAQKSYLGATALEPLGYAVDASKLSTITDANQLPVGDTTRATYATNGFVAELLNYYTKPESTDFASQAVDVFRDEAGRDAVHASLDAQVKSSTTAKVIEEGGGTKPTVLQVTSGDTTTTTAYFDVGNNAIVVVRSQCSGCTPEDALKAFQPLLDAVYRQAGVPIAR